MSLDCLVNRLSCFIMTKTECKCYTEVQANLLTKACQNIDPQNPYKETADESEISNMYKVQNPYKLPVNPQLTAFIEKPDESASNVIGYYHYSNEDNNR